MNSAAKLSAFGAGLALIFVGAYAIGTVVGPLSPAASGFTVTPTVATITPSAAESGVAPTAWPTAGHTENGHGH